MKWLQKAQKLLLTPFKACGIIISGMQSLEHSEIEETVSRSHSGLGRSFYVDSHDLLKALSGSTDQMKLLKGGFVWLGTHIQCSWKCFVMKLEG